MLLANIAVSEKIANAFSDTALLRRHAPPVAKALNDTLGALIKQGIDLNASNSKALNDSFDAIEDPIKNLVTRLQVIKAMKRAEYFCTASLDISEFFHYGLSVPLYTHFTSPIRRYCDLIVHRMLEATLNGQNNMYTTDQVHQFAEQCNQRKFASKDAQDASQNLYLCALLSTKEKEGKVLCEAYVSKIGARAVDVIVPRYGMESRVWVEDSMELGDVAGCDSNEDKGELYIHWNHGKGIQTVKAFDTITVFVVTTMSSPPRFKLFFHPPQ
jgi:exoribonuclease R